MTERCMNSRKDIDQYDETTAAILFLFFSIYVCDIVNNDSLCRETKIKIIHFKTAAICTWLLNLYTPQCKLH